MTCLLFTFRCALFCFLDGLQVPLRLRAGSPPSEGPSPVSGEDVCKSRPRERMPHGKSVTVSCSSVTARCLHANQNNMNIV